MQRANLAFNIILVPVDYAMLVLSGIATYFLRTHIVSVFRPVLFEFNLPFERYLFLLFAVSWIFIGVYAISGLYNWRVSRGVVEESIKIFVATSATTMIIIVYIFLRQELFDSRFLILGAWLMAAIFVSAGRFFIRRIQKFTVSRFGYGIRKVMVIGDDKISSRIIDGMKDNLELGYRVVKQLGDLDVSEVKSSIGNLGVDEVILANPNYPESRVLEIIDFCHENHIDFKFVPNIYQALTANATVEVFAGIPIVDLKRTALDGWGSVAKRIIDIVGASFGLLVLSPLFLIIAFAIKWETEGLVFVRLGRVSKNKSFNLLKFRSMINNAEKYKPMLEKLNERSDGPLFKMKDDPRTTKVGKFIRKTRLDELPQLWNVLVGDISLVGPRPHQPDEIAKYQKHHKKVLAIKAGATGLAQVSGSSDLSFEKEVALDTVYIEKWSLFQDIKIILKTIVKMFRDPSAA
ncbi:MAG: hypothetical protein COV29_01325 [Candidatus Yanofskybacteria bacterium CG10_big_fil_rev_8_21_14_0_10_36_16]|uniref:Bacterial sugar transferase domain-containing protein n=1 Tax=Candidatus Yanofskybacteria bacterium CG10_big_fil_rev_8_21_14_0_10_36_16 TaxID=1975096 RepID=A0A2J0Q8A7_9BACT|nr:MAG: hypothetical protein COV29_01325 [Candidatus Yanofskybacteria bacterium CG10_big_fil_rev_8_21_14_0_10_36_16]